MAGWSVVFGLAATLAISTATGDTVPTDSRAPHIKPDYSDLIIPPNIAPLNFAVLESGDAWDVTVKGTNGPVLKVQSRVPSIQLPEKQWAQLLAGNRGGQIQITIRALGANKQWSGFAPITNRVANENIDPVLIYRKVHPVQSLWSDMGIYQRDLRNFNETPILVNRHFGNDCCHCHVFRNNDPENAMIIIRSVDFQNTMLVVSNGMASAIQGSAGFTAFHPAGRIVVSSFAKPRLLLHSAKRNDMRDIGDVEGWLGCYQLGSDAVQKVPVADSSHLLAFPVWAPDGAYLYYCDAPKPENYSMETIGVNYASVKYDLKRVSYDMTTGKWGSPEVVVSSRELGFSAAQPRVSPDGRRLYFCATAYGCWPPFDPGSDLYGVDLVEARRTGKFAWRKLELNSDEAESILNWSSNSRWVVFSSKRGSPLFSRPHLAYVAADGTTGKPFILPQKDPTHYDSLLATYTIPTLVTGPMAVPQKDLVNALKDSHKKRLVMPGAK